MARRSRARPYHRRVYPNRPRSNGREPALLRVGRFFGVPLYFAPSWVLIATLITILYSSIVRSLVDGVSTTTSYVAAFAFAVALAICVLAHELGHTAVSLALGKPVRRVVIFLLGGVSEIEGEMERARDELLIAFAGPLVSALIAGLAAGAAVFASPGSLAAALLDLLIWSNVIVAVFNLLPGLPLDGGRVLRAAIWAISRSWGTGTRVAGWAGRLIAAALAVSAVAFLFYGWGTSTLLIDLLLAGFIWSGATQALRGAGIAERLATVRITDLLRPGLLVHSDVSVAEALRRIRESAAGGIVVTDSYERPRAIVEESRVRQLPLERQPWTTVGELARVLEPGLILPETLGPGELIAAVRATPAAEYLVVHPDGSLAGVLTATDLAAALGPASTGKPTNNGKT
jgi:Zn-dependent protease/CBS domain-containing protein